MKYITLISKHRQAAMEDIISGSKAEIFIKQLLTLLTL